jgi:hypothetical protein
MVAKSNGLLRSARRLPEWAGAHEPRLARVRRLPALLLVLVGATAQAQVTDPSVFSFVPDPPRAGRAFDLVIRVNPCLHGTWFLSAGPLDRELSVTQGRIEVTMPYAPTLLCPSPGIEPHDQVIRIDPVPAGAYAIVVFGQDVSYPDDPDFRIERYATNVTVAAQPPTVPRPATIPAVSPLSLGVLGSLLLLLGGLFAWRRKGS